MKGLAGIRTERVGPPRRLLAAAAVLIATVWLAAAPAASADAAASPFVLAPGLGLYDQFGYAPAYTRNVPAFDESGRAYIRSRTSSGNATSYVQARDAGSWTRLDFLAALRAAYPSFVQTVGAGGLRNDGLVFDRQGRAYNPVTLQVGDGTTRNALLVSWDHCRTWKVFKLPEGTFTTERWVGHNELDGPPFLAVWRTSAPPDVPGSQTNALYVTQPRLEGDQLVLPPLVKVTERCLGLSRDSGGASFAVTRGETTWFVWSEIAPRGGGTPHYISTYDHVTGTTSGRYKLATSPERSDQHDKPGICLDTAGYLHVIAGGHGSPALYTRSLAPLTAVAGWTAPMPVLGTGWTTAPDPSAQQGRQTYPAFVCDGRDTLHLVTRQWRRGVDPYLEGKSYAALVHQSCASGGAWGEPTIVVAGAYSGYGVFFHKLALDARDRLFISCSYQGGPELRQERARRAALSVLGRTQLRPGKYRGRMLLVSDDGGAAWRFAADADLEAPDEAGRRTPAPPQVAAGSWGGRAAVEPPATTWRWLCPLPQGNQFTGLTFPTAWAGWAVGTHGTVRRTTDGGRHWTVQSVPSVADLFAVAAVDADRAWAVGAGGTILRTTNGGATWVAPDSGTTRDLFAVCAISARDVWAVGAHGTILHSLNAGRSWAVSPTSSDAPLFGVAFGDRQHGLVSGGQGELLYTHNGGGNWERRRSSSPGSLFSLAMLNDGHAVAAGEGGVLLTSADHGWTWRQCRTGTKDTLRAVRLLPSGRVWASGGRSVLSSRDGGRRWTASPLPIPGPCGALAAANRRLVLVGGAGGGLCRSADGGGTWRSLGLGPRSAWTDALVAGDEVWAAGAGGTLLRADAAGASRILQTVAEGADLSGLASAGARGWVVGRDGTVATSVDAGSTWTTLAAPTAEDLTAVAAPTSHTVVVAGRAGTLLRSTDAGASWQPSSVTSDDLLCLAFVDGTHGWAGGGATFGETRAEVFRTLDGGLTWDEVDLPLWGRVRDLCFVDERTGWAAVEDWGIDGDRPQGAILATADGGETWTRQATTATGLLAVSVGADGAGWACGERGLVLQTADGGLTWTARDAGTDSTLRAATITAPGEVWLAGDDGAIVAGAPAPR